MRPKIRKNTKTYKEWTKVYKALQEQERYYRQKGIDLPSVKDLFARSDVSAKNLRELKKYRTAFKARVKQVKEMISKIRKQFGVGTRDAYQLAAESMGEEPLKMSAVIFDSFREKIDKLALRHSRETMRRFTNKLIDTVGEEEAARVLQQTAEEDRLFEVLTYYNKEEEETQHLYNLMNKMIEKADPGALTRDELVDFMETIA